MTGLKFSHQIFSEAAAMSLLNIWQVSLLLIHFLQRSTLTKRPVSSPITGTWVLLEISTRVERQQTLSHLNPHVVNRPLYRNRKSIPKFSSGQIKNFSKNVTLQNPNLILRNRMLNIFPIWCNVNFETVFSALNNTK